MNLSNGGSNLLRKSRISSGCETRCDGEFSSMQLVLAIQCDCRKEYWVPIVLKNITSLSVVQFVVGVIANSEPCALVFQMLTVETTVLLERT